MNSTEKSHRNLSGIEIQRCYGPEDIANFDSARDLGVPGEFPFTRGIYRPCTGDGYGPCASSPALARLKKATGATIYLLQQGNTGFDDSLSCIDVLLVCERGTPK